MKIQKLPLAVIALLLFGLLFGASMVAWSLRTDQTEKEAAVLGGGDNRSYNQVYTVSPGGTLKVHADCGGITVTGTDKKEVSIHVTAEGSERMLKRFEVTSSQDGNVVTLRGKLANKYFQWFDDNSIDVHYTVEVPKEYALSIHTAGGDMEIRNIKGKVDGETSGGELTVDDIEGTIRLTSSGGDVRAENLNGDITLETSGGSIIGSQLVGPLMVETSGGNIDLRGCSGKVHASTSGGNVRVAATDNKGIDLSTSGGNVTLHLPKSVSANISAETTGGDVNCDFPFNGKLRDGSLHGTINGGGNSIRLETSGGEIVISPAE